MSENKRKRGWYWVRLNEYVKTVPMYWDGNYFNFCDLPPMEENNCIEIYSERIPEPGEMDKDILKKYVINPKGK